MTHGLMDNAVYLNRIGRESDKKDLYWILSNICAGTPDQIESVIRRFVMQDDGLLDTMQDRSYKRCDFEVAVNAFYTISNAIHGSQRRQIELLTRCNTLFVLFKFLPIAKQEEGVFMEVLFAIERFLQLLDEKMQDQLMD